MFNPQCKVIVTVIRKANERDRERKDLKYMIMKKFTIHESVGMCQYFFCVDFVERGGGWRLMVCGRQCQVRYIERDV